MEEMGTGVGLAALGFWLMIAAAAVASAWDSIRKREAQHETLRRLIESGSQIDQVLMDRLLGHDKRLDRDFKAAGLITLSCAPGLVIMGWLLSYLAYWALFPLLGAAAIVACVGIGLLVAAKAVAASYREDDPGTDRFTG